ncbi:aldehyde dehydrogenase family protein [Rhizorhabdus wittichii]|uniref:aldehyde dehydrogenase family protein n=1 Tax=Rhizorhabdus wittichii TaxID=160791 RepID=UPI001D00483D|nr:aldehyde dehydrogenase family protein [Rhizorhabdus wittichii]
MIGFDLAARDGHVADGPDFRMLIGGELVAGVGVVDVIDPADESIVAQCPIASEAQFDQAVAAAQAAFGEWRHVPPVERARMLRALGAAVAARGEELARLLTREQGKTLAQARDEVRFACAFVDYFADNTELPVEIRRDDDGQRIEIRRRPLGVIAAICPWNFPLLITLYKLAPAVAVGNTVIIKPAPTTPLTSLRIGEIARDVFPAGVVNIIADDNRLGPAITAHPGIAKLSFTGSTPTGKAIMASAAGTLKRLTLELGGNDAAIVLDDVDPAAIAEAIFGAAFVNSGQVCIALKRLYVHASIYDEMCDRIAALARAAVVGPGNAETSQFGPVQNRRQYDKVRGYIDDARRHGRIVAGGVLPEGPGFHVPLTVVRDIADGCAVVDEEPFGPVLPIISYTDLDDVVARANASPYGLGASVWSSDAARGAAVARRIESGTVWVNQHCAFGPDIPFPPAKESGLGVEWGRDGLLEYTAMQVININKS